jgi:hypothetical protein
VITRRRILASILAAGSEPLLLTERLDALRRAIRQTGSTHALAWAQMLARLKEEMNWFSRASSNWNYGRSARAQAAALAYQISGEVKWSRLAYQSLHEIHADPDKDARLPESGYGLSRAAVGAGFAYGWNWARDGWTEGERAEIRGRIEAALEAWPRYEHANLGHTRGSNWVAVCRGGELILRHCAGDGRRIDFLERELLEHVAHGYDSLGVTQEGIGYCGYAASYLMQAALVHRAAGRPALYEAIAEKAFWKQLMYAGSFSVTRNPAQRLFLMSGVGGPMINDEGFASMAIPFVPDEELQGFLWWYDRHAGRLSGGAPLERFDWQRGGGMWTLLTYPFGVEGREPRPGRRAVSGEQGTCFFRDRWRDGSDIQISIAADARWHSHAWDQPEALQLGLLAGGCVFLGGPNKERSPDRFSTLLIDGEMAPQKPPSNGRLLAFEPTARGGRVEVHGGPSHPARRQLLVDFDESEGALFSTLDAADGDGEHELTWQAWLDALPEAAPRLAVESSRVFSLTAPSGYRIRGWVMTPGARIEGGRTLRVKTKAANARLWIVFTGNETDAPRLATDSFTLGARRLFVADGSIRMEKG